MVAIVVRWQGEHNDTIYSCHCLQGDVRSMVVQNEQDWVIDGAVGVADEGLQEDGEGFFIHPSRLCRMTYGPCR